jgi:hypothetical protein
MFEVSRLVAQIYLGFDIFLFAVLTLYIVAQVVLYAFLRIQ